MPAFHETVAHVPPATCFGCGATIPERDAYCDECVRIQHEAHKREMHAFDAYHAWIDSIPKR